MLKKASNALSKLPGVDRLLTSQTGRRLEASFGHAALTRAIRNALDELRAALRQGTDADISASTILTFVERALEKRKRTSIRPVFNLTGTVLHTNLGRAFLPEDAVEAVAHVARGASNLEYEIETGRRGDRDSHVERQICEITGAEAATVVNNNAAAVMLVLNTLALGKEVPVSRGELVEIGGSFRIPDIMERSGCKLIEVGTTNRTHLKDFAAVLGQETAMVMKVHTSNYVIEGFTKAVSEPELARLCRDRDLPFVNDLGSGTLANLEDFGLPHEPTPMDALKNGADVVTFSGDKLLGGPQAGLIVGRSALIKRIKSNPLKRALRCDKMTIAALAAILQLYSDPSRLAERLPVLRALTRE
ncbi:MAG: L-seryl-tRNA(Sec) selenium transferase, partial [Hyphomicrobiaceae bacterium]